MERAERRTTFAAGLRAEAERRFGAARAQALEQTIADVAGWMADVATFPVESDEHPQFYVESDS